VQSRIVAVLLPPLWCLGPTSYTSSRSRRAPHTLNTMPEKTHQALTDHGEIGAMLPQDGGR
jgi:hypothetical protein